jgi:hypothetical protein
MLTSRVILVLGSEYIVDRWDWDSRFLWSGGTCDSTGRLLDNYVIRLPNAAPPECDQVFDSTGQLFMKRACNDLIVMKTR